MTSLAEPRTTTLGLIKWITDRGGFAYPADSFANIRCLEGVPGSEWQTIPATHQAVREWMAAK